MKRSLSLVIAGALFLAACAGGAPNLVLEEQQADLGEVVNGELRTLQIPIRNDGQGDLIIEAVSTSCGCTQASVDPMTIPAGGTATLNVTYDSGAHGPDANGPATRQVFIASNDPDTPEAVFTFEVVVLPADS